MFNPENPLHVTAYTTLNAIYIEEREKLDTPPVVVEQITTPVVLKEEPTPVEVVPVIAEETPAKPEPTMEGQLAKIALNSVYSTNTGTLPALRACFKGNPKEIENEES